MKHFKVGVIGTGYIGRVHLEMLCRIPEVKVIAVMNRTLNRAEAAAERFDIPKVYSDAYKLIEDNEIDVIHNCMSNNLHFNINRHAIEKGKAVLSEKPLTMDSSESAELVRLAQEHDTVTGVNFCYRYYPIVQEAAARVRRGDAGEIRAVVGHFLQDWLAFDTDYSWRLDPAVTGKTNVMADLGSHWCDLIQFITGLRIIEVMAEFHTCIPVRKKCKAGPMSFSRAEGAEEDFENVPIKLEDFASLFLRLENGARGNFTTCQVAQGRKVDINIQVFGSKESYTWSHEHPSELLIGHRERANETFFESPILQTEDTRKYATLPTGHPMGYHDAVLNMFRDFYAAVASKREGKYGEIHHPDFSTGHVEMCIIEAAVESSRKCGWVKVRW